MLIVASALSNWLSRGFDSLHPDDHRLVSLSAFISLVIGLGLIRAALAILDGGRPSVEQLVSTKDIGPYIIASLLVALIVTVGLVLCIIPGLIAGFLLQFYGYAIIDRKADSVTTAPQSTPTGAHPGLVRGRGCQRRAPDPAGRAVLPGEPRRCDSLRRRACWSRCRSPPSRSPTHGGTSPVAGSPPATA